MSTFLLYIHDGKELEAQEINAISNKLIHFSWVSTSIYSGKNVQLIYTTNKSDTIDIFKSKENGLTFFLQGNIFESEKGIEKIDQTKYDYTLENQIIKRYLKNGILSCVGLNGMYNLLVWDERNHIFEIAGDRLGIFQIFFAAINDKQFVLTSDIVTIKSIPGFSPTIDKRGIFDLLYMGVAFEERTVVEGVRRLSPNSCYRISGGRLKLVQEFRLPFSKKRWNYVTPKILDDLGYYYIQAVKRQLSPDNKITFLQSGGKDSRVFSYFLKQANITPRCVTAGENHHGEVFFAKQVSKALGFPWRRIPINQQFNLTFVDEFLSIDSFSSRFIPPFFMEVIYKKTANTDCVTSTFLGDSFFGAAIKKGEIENDASAEGILNNYLTCWREGCFAEHEIERLFAQQGKDWIQEYKKEAYELFIKLGDEPYQMLIAYGLRSNDRFKIGSALRSINAILPMRLPCIDNDLMDFAFSLPPTLLYDRFVLDIFLKKHASKLTAIPIDQNSSNYYALTHSIKSELISRLWSSYTKKIIFPILRFTKPTSATSQFYVEIFSMRDEGFRKVMRRCLSLLPAVKGIMDMPTVEKMLKKELPLDRDHIKSGNSTRSLITSILAARTFNDN